jgi:hypothetical protein
LKDRHLSLVLADDKGNEIKMIAFFCASGMDGIIDEYASTCAV